MTSRSSISCTLLLFALAGCSSESNCPTCGACSPTFTALVTLTGAGASVEIDGEPCTADGDVFRCVISTVPGTRAVLIEAPGFVTSTESVTTPNAPPGCCSCSPDATRDVTLRREGEDDGGVVDAGVDAATLVDASSVDASSIDTGSPSCDESQVTFRPSGGSLEPGQLCDDVFACAVDADDAARIVAAAPSFECSPTPEGPCTGITCVFRPSTLDAAEIQEVCALTTLSPPPELTCMIYL